MGRAVFLQAAATVLVAAIAAIIGGVHAASSAALGGLACVLPNALFAFRLAAEMRRPGGATVQGFFVGEFVKLAVTVLILFTVARTYRDLNWPALIAGFIVALKSYFFLFAFGRRHA